MIRTGLFVLLCAASFTALSQDHSFSAHWHDEAADGGVRHGRDGAPFSRRLGMEVANLWECNSARINEPL